MRDQIKKHDMSIFAVDIDNSVAATTDWNYLIDYIDYRILGKLGLVYKSKSFNLGLTLTTPSIHIYGTGVISGRATSTGVYVGEIPNTSVQRPYDYVASKKESGVATNYISPLSAACHAPRPLAASLPPAQHESSQRQHGQAETPRLRHGNAVVRSL